MFKVLTQNIWGMNNNWQVRADLIGQQMDARSVDMICIQESSPDHFAYLKNNSFAAWPYAVYAPSDDGTVTPGTQGLAMFSKHAIVATGQFNLGREDHPEIDPWMRIIHFVQVQIESLITVFNTHLFLNKAQKKQGIDGCTDFITQLRFASSFRMLVGDFNIHLNQPERSTLLSSLTDAGFSDVWMAVNPDDPGLTWPLDHDRVPIVRLDAHFVESAQLNKVHSIELVNDELLQDGALYLSDHTGVLGQYAL